MTYIPCIRLVSRHESAVVALVSRHESAVVAISAESLQPGASGVDLMVATVDIGRAGGPSQSWCLKQYWVVTRNSPLTEHEQVEVALATTGNTPVLSAPYTHHFDKNFVHTIQNFPVELRGAYSLRVFPDSTRPRWILCNDVVLLTLRRAKCAFAIQDLWQSYPAVGVLGRGR